MTKKDYILIAEVLKHYQASQNIDEDKIMFLANLFSYFLKQENKKFDRLKFCESIINK